MEDIKKWGYQRWVSIHFPLSMIAYALCTLNSIHFVWITGTGATHILHGDAEGAGKENVLLEILLCWSISQQWRGIIANLWWGLLCCCSGCLHINIPRMPLCRPVCGTQRISFHTHQMSMFIHLIMHDDSCDKGTKRKRERTTTVRLCIVSIYGFRQFLQITILRGIVYFLRFFYPLLLFPGEVGVVSYKFSGTLNVNKLKRRNELFTYR